MHYIPIHTRPMQPPQDDIYSLLDTYLQDIHDGDILFITSKVVSIHQGLCIPVDTTSKIDLVKREAEKYIVSDIVPGKDIYLTLKNNIIIPSAGIDESNADGHYILWPRDMGDFCTQVHTHICTRYGIKNLGIVITDSTTRPLRWGVVGTGIYSYGFAPLRDERGHTDIFGKILAITQINILDAITAGAVYTMGEGAECQPLCIGRDIPGIEYGIYTGTEVDKKYMYESISIPPENDLYRDLLRPLIGTTYTSI